MSKTKGIIALSPIFVFATLYLITSIVAKDFYAVPLTVAFLFSCIYAVGIVSKGSFNSRIESFCHNAGQPNIMLMLAIFILAGAFASSAKGMGGIDATVNFTLNILPSNMLLAGLFLSACFISLSIGTSVGTIAALVPIAAGLAPSTGLSTAFLTGIVVGGAFFGDNLSFISDTTIMATQTQGCKMSDKFKANIFIVLPAALVILAIYFFIGRNVSVATGEYAVDWVKILPYVIVIITAVCGLNVMIVLTIGLVLCGIIGLCDGSYTVFTWMQAMGNGIMGMSELVMVTILAAGLLGVINDAKGIEFIIERISSKINGKRGAEFTIGALVAMVNICTANNTIAILTVGDISHNIAETYGVDSKKAASILDTFSCCTQGLLPYGAQLLIAAGLVTINPIDIVPYLYYPMAIGVAAIMSIALRYPRRYS